MAVTDLNFAFSGIMTFADGSSGVMEAYYDSKGGSYVVDGVEGLEIDQQLAHANSGNVMTRVSNFFVLAFDSALGLARSGDPDVPATIKVINGGTLHVRGMLTEDDNSKTPISTTFDISQLDVDNINGVSHVGASDRQKWDDEAWGTAGAWQDLLEATLAQVVANASIE
jgi:hypothetical protein